VFLRLTLNINHPKSCSLIHQTLLKETIGDIFANGAVATGPILSDNDARQTAGLSWRPRRRPNYEHLFATTGDAGLETLAPAQTTFLGQFGAPDFAGTWTGTVS